MGTNRILWRHNERDGVSNPRRLDCLLNRLFRRRSKKTSKLCVTCLCEGNPPVTGGFPSQRASNAENISTLWRHHEYICPNANGVIVNDIGRDTKWIRRTNNIIIRTVWIYWSYASLVNIYTGVSFYEMDIFRSIIAILRVLSKMAWCLWYLASCFIHNLCELFCSCWDLLCKRRITY